MSNNTQKDAIRPTGPARKAKRTVRDAVAELALAPHPDETPVVALTRILKAHYDSPEAARSSIDDFAHLTLNNPGAVWIQVKDLWGKLQFVDDGNNGWEWAVRRIGQASHISLSPDFLTGDDETDHVLTQLVRLAWLMHIYNGGDKPFLLLQRRIADWLFDVPAGGKPASNKPVSLGIHHLRKAGVLECANESFSFGHGAKNKGKLYTLGDNFLSGTGWNIKTLESDKPTEYQMTADKQEEHVGVTAGDESQVQF